MYCVGEHNCQHHEVCFRYLIIWLYEEYATIMLVIVEAPTVPIDSRLGVHCKMGLQPLGVGFKAWALDCCMGLPKIRGPNMDPR